MLKRILCLVLCLMLALPAAMAETADTLQKKFSRQLTGGNGIRGKLSLTASGVAEWLDMLLPFVGTDIQIRAMGEKQGDMSADIADDDDWQIKLYAENAAGSEVATTWLYGDPTAVYFQSELLPDTCLSLPVEQVNLLYQMFKGEYAELFFAFDPFALTLPGKNGNASAYEAVTEMLGVSQEEWNENWMPVLEKYFLQLDLWLTGYGDPSFVTGEEGPLTMEATYVIPADDIKREAKYLISQMLFDNTLQNLLLPYVTLEQRITYLNQTLVYFYEACIDALPLEGDVILSRQMSAMGEVVSTTVALPLPVLPEKLTAPVGEMAAAMFRLPYDDLLSGMNRISFVQREDEKIITLSGEKRTLTLTAQESQPDENTTEVEGSLRITPNVGVDENSLSATYTWSYGHRIWQDESYLDHDETAFALRVEPDLDMLSEDDPFRNTYVDFAPLSVDWTVDYRNNAYQESSPVQINVSASAKLPDALIGLDMVLRITTKLAMSPLKTSNAVNFAVMTEEQKTELLSTLTKNAEKVLSSLNSPVPDNTVVPAAEPNVEAEKTPPVTE